MQTGQEKHTTTVKQKNKEIIWFRWKDNKITPKWKSIDLQEQRKRQVILKVNRMLKGWDDPNGEQSTY